MLSLFLVRLRVVIFKNLVKTAEKHVTIQSSIGEIIILLNDWDITRYYFGIRSGVVLLVGIALNIFTMRKNYPWVKYVNNLVIIYTIFVLGAFTDLIAMLFIMIPFINSFYFRPRFTAITGVVCIVMMYFSFMIITATIFNENGDIDYNFFSIIQFLFSFSSRSNAAVGGRHCAGADYPGRWI